MKEVINNYRKDKSEFWRKTRNVAGVAGVLLVLTACEKQPEITDGIVYEKEYIYEDWGVVGNKFWASHQEIDKEVISMPPLHEEIGYYSKETLTHLHQVKEYWKVHIAKYPTDQLPKPEKIEKECKTESFEVPQEKYSSYILGQHADFKQPK